MKILYGIQPTGRIHLGNYLGGIKKAIEMQGENGVTFLIAQFHSLTTLSEKEIKENCVVLKEKLKKLGAKNIKYQIKDNLLVSWAIMCQTPVSHLQKMTQWKDKGKGNAGLLTYPCLMAADIMLSNCDAVIVGEDQTQHFEFYRDICKKFNIKPAEMILTETPRIMSIKDPTKKMSKSLGDEHCIYLFSDNKEKIMKAPTTPEGIKNLKMIAKEFGMEFDENDCYNSKIKLNDLINKI